jgi:hypothetical protein
MIGDDFRAWFDERLKPLHEWAAGIIGRGLEVEPCVVVFGPDDTLQVLPLDFESIAKKNIAVDLHQLLARLGGSPIMMSEAWMVANMSAADAAVTKSLEDHPDRFEAIIWNALRGDRQLLAHARINRPDNTLGEIVVIDPRRELLSGRMAADEHRKGH